MITVARKNSALIGVAAAIAVTMALLLTVQGGAGTAFFGDSANLATQLGISATAAYKLMDTLNSWYFTVLLAALTGGWGAGLVRIAVSLASRYGKKYAAMW